MRLHSIRLSEFRRFREPLVLDDLQAGINLFVGPNEAGKSTVAAAVRAAFLERYKTSKVADFAPYGLAAPRPTVELEFETGGRRYSLRKSFLTRPRCELIVDGGRRLEGEQADDALAALLGYVFPGKGQSRPEHAGVPGLLWIQQGESATRTPIEHARMHLREALQRVSGELASGDGDRLLVRVEADLAELLDARGKPRAAYREAEAELARVQADIDALQAAHRVLNEAIDQLAGLRLAHAEDERDPPWVGFERQAAQAREREQQAVQQRHELDVLLRERRQYDEQLALLHDGAMRVQADIDELARLRRELRRLEEAADAHAASAAGEAQAVAQAAERARLARERHEAARQLAERRDVQGMVERQQSEAQRLRHAHREAQRLAAELARVREQLHRETLSEPDLTQLRELERECEALALRREATATRLRYELPDGGVRLDGTAVAGRGERWLDRPMVIELANGGRLDVLPGGQDLAQLAERANALQAQRAQLFAALGVDSLARAEARWATRQAHAGELGNLQRELDIHAPQGLAALEQTCFEAQALLERLQARLAQFAPSAEAPGALDLNACATERELAETAWRQLQERGEARRMQAQQALTHLAQARERERALAERLESAAATGQQAQRAMRLAEAKAQRDAIEQRIELAKARLEGHDSQLNRQDIDRLERSARIAREAFQARHERMLLLQGRLDEAGAQGLGERLAEVGAEAERLQRRVDGLALRARALRMLREALRERREAATSRLQAPLAERLAHYLRLLFGEASLQLDENLLPTQIVRPDHTLGLDALSHGTQEQLGVLARIAYADILREAGRPTLLILDDALVHTDAQRLGWIKRALFDAATRHQVLVFSCHAAAWRDLGVAARELGDDRPTDA
ncbi:AAA family ATPase [Verticiella sediminum]|uniref:AAA family ATPase n=1 Tax=Verticiella sediminum TaxID=1247510 RepID=A0A556ASA3_9BURK|nr:AAA family ATPase [Verticiella sediminum]TSH95808.1 AAA family ATPase [Verticiella sediminum]